MLNSIYKMLSGNLVKIIIQSILFISLARFLGVENFGLFSIYIAMAGLFCSFDALGAGSVLLKKISRNRDSFKNNALTVILIHIVCACFLIFCYLGIVNTIFDKITFMTSFKFALSELLFYSLILLQNQIYQALNKFSLIVMNNIGLSLVRLLSILTFGYFSDFSIGIDELASVYLFATLIWFLISVIIFFNKCRISTEVHKGEVIPIIQEGIHFSLSKLAAVGNSEVDKGMIGQIKGASEAGIYSASSKIINMVMVPVNTVFSVTMPKYFKYGAEGITRNYQFSLKFVPYLLLYATISGLLILSFADFAVVLLGDSYGDVTVALKYLAFFPFLKVISTSLADTIAGAGFQASKSKAQLISLIVNVSLNIILIPLYSWLGAIISIFISEVLLTLMYLGTAFKYRNIQK